MLDIDAYRMERLKHAASKRAEQEGCHWTESAIAALTQPAASADEGLLADLMAQMRLARVFICTPQNMSEDQYYAFQGVLERLVVAWEESWHREKGAAA